VDDVAGLANGNYVVTSAVRVNNAVQIDAQIFNGTTAVGSAFRVDNPSQGQATSSKIALLGDGDFVIAWQDNVGANNDVVTHAQTYHPDGTAFGTEVTKQGALGDLSSVGSDRFIMSLFPIGGGATAGIFSASDDASHSELIQNQATGAIDFLSANGPALTQSALSTNLWPVVGEGDFNGDGQMDLVTQKNGAIDFVFMQGSNITGSDLLSGSYWNFVGTGYFPGFFPLALGGGPELITQSAAGQIDLLHFFGSSLNASGLLNGTYDHVVGAGDFYGNGQIEIATQNSVGQIDLLTFNGTNLVASALVPGTYWTVKGVADVNHDGTSDFITENSATGQIDYLMMSGAQVTGSLLENTAIPGWNVVNASQTADQFFHGA
jgi:hypothetical protein